MSTLDTITSVKTEQANRSAAEPARGVFWPWISANTLGLGLGMAVFAAVAEGVEQSGIVGSPAAGELAGHLVGLALAGALFGAMQRRVLRRYGAVSAWPILGAIVGLMLGYIAGYELGGPPIDFVLAPTLAALFAGIQQAAALRSTLRGACRWPWVSAAGFLVGAVMGTALAVAGLGDAIGGGYIGWIVLNGIVFASAGAIGGMISGAFLRR